MDKISLVVTTINDVNESLTKLSSGSKSFGWDFIVIGDKKTPPNFSLSYGSYYSVVEQKKLDLHLGRSIPFNHYSRKNIGYLIAINNKSDIIVETDDDNIPYDTFFSPRQRSIKCKSLSNNGWTNVYKFFSKKIIWPRGFPLECIQDDMPPYSKLRNNLGNYPIQQGLADLNPDVDAIYRLTNKLPFRFTNSGNIGLKEYAWCPFNSQNTTWWRDSFPLMYLPSYCSFRMTDIWRSFIAQRIAWEYDWGVYYHESTVYQERNEHNLLNDFKLEIEGYLLNDKIRVLLESIELDSSKSLSTNLKTCYKHLVYNEIFPANELDLVDAWLNDIESLI